MYIPVYKIIKTMFFFSLLTFFFPFQVLVFKKKNKLQLEQTLKLFYFLLNSNKGNIWDFSKLSNFTSFELLNKVAHFQVKKNITIEISKYSFNFSSKAKLTKIFE